MIKGKIVGLCFLLKGEVFMFFKIVSKKRIEGINELVYEVAYNDTRYFLVRASVYEKFNNGEYRFSYVNGEISFADADGNEIPKEKGVY